jgi:hypothetical protein
MKGSNVVWCVTGLDLADLFLRKLVMRFLYLEEVKTFFWQRASASHFVTERRFMFKLL